MTKALAQKPVDKLKLIINQPTVQEQFKNALGRRSDLFIASLIDTFNDGLQKCDPGTVIQEALKAAVLKLPISKNLGFAYIVPYKGKPQFQIGYKGLIQLAMRSGQVKILNAGPVYEGEFKDFNKLTGLVDLSGKQTSEKIIGYFAYMELINGFQKTVYWDTEQVHAHAKAKSPSYKYGSSAWKTDFDAMATKTVLRALLSKYAPMSIDFIATAECNQIWEETEESVNLSLDSQPNQIAEASPAPDINPPTPSPPSSTSDMTGWEPPYPPQKFNQPSLNQPAPDTSPEPCKEVRELIKLKKTSADVIRQCIDAGDFTQRDIDNAINDNNQESAIRVVGFIADRF